MKKEEQCKKILEFICKELNTKCEGKIRVAYNAYNGKFALAENPCHIVFISGTRCFNVFRYAFELSIFGLCASSCARYFRALKTLLKQQKLVCGCEFADNTGGGE